MLRLQLRLDEETFSALATKAIRAGQSLPEAAGILIRDALVPLPETDPEPSSRSPLMSSEPREVPALNAA